MKKKTKAQLAADKAFMAKLHTITFGTGAAKVAGKKSPLGFTCKLVGAGIMFSQPPPPTQRTNTSNDQSFSA